jgi:hypothetical protein
MGTQRSGTTLLTRILSAHPDLFIQNELPLAKVFTAHASKQTIINNVSEIFQRRHGFSVENLIQKQKKRLWGIKDPQLTEYIPQLAEFLPQSKFIIIVRDGRGVANSYIENKWGLGTNAYSGAKRWKQEVQQQQALMSSCPANVLFVRFEDLVADMDTQLKNICAHLDVEFTEEMLNYHSQNAAYVPNKENINTYKKPDSGISEKWQKKLTTKEIDVIESLVGDELSANGYKLIGKKINISPLHKFYYSAHQAIIGELQLQYQLKRVKLKGKLKQWRKQL